MSGIPGICLWRVVKSINIIKNIMGILESSDMINWFLFLERSTLMLKNGLIYFSAPVQSLVAK